MRGAFSALIVRYRYPGRCPGLVCAAPLARGGGGSLYPRVSPPVEPHGRDDRAYQLYLRASPPVGLRPAHRYGRGRPCYRRFAGGSLFLGAVRPRTVSTAEARRLQAIPVPYDSGIVGTRPLQGGTRQYHRRPMDRPRPCRHTRPLQSGVRRITNFACKCRCGIYGSLSPPESGKIPSG